MLLEKQMSATQQVQRLIQRQQHNTAINAFISFDEANLHAQAAKLDALDKAAKTALPLFAQPVIVKDNIETADIPTTAGSKYFLDNIPAENATVVQRLIDAGAIIAGKGNMHELAFGISSNNAAFGCVHNPHKQGYIPGGSSGGTAAAIAADIVPLGLGTDTGGSMRIPASLCGIVGFRPTTGRYPSTGLVLVSPTRDTVGPMARSVDEIIALDHVLANDTAVAAVPTMNGLRLGVPTAYFNDSLEPEIKDTFEQLLTSLRKAGVELIAADIPEICELNAAISFVVAIYEAKENFHRYAEQNGGDFSGLAAATLSPDVKDILMSIENDGGVPEEAYRDAMENQRPRIQQTYQSYFAKHHVAAVMFPTTPLVSRPIGQDETVEFLGESQPTFPTYIRNTDPGSNAGIPGISLPLGMDSAGLPFGVELDGAASDDVNLLMLAKQLESHITLNLS